MRTVTFSALLFLLANVSAQAAPQVPDARQRQILAVIDTDGDSFISRAELRSWLHLALQRQAAKAGLTAETGTNVFETYVTDLSNRILNDSTADGNDTIAPAEIPGMDAVALLPPFGGTVKDLLPKAPAVAKQAPGWPDRLERWVDIRQSFLDEQNIGKPAKLALTNHAEDDETVAEGKPRRVYTLRASVILSGFLEWNPVNPLYVRPILGYEVDLDSSAPKKDRVAHRFGLGWDYVRDPQALFAGHRFVTTFDIKTDRSYEANVLGASFQYTPNSPVLGIGRFLGGGKPVDFRWRPYLGLVLANVKDAGGVEAYQQIKDFDHLFAKATGELRLGPRIKVTPQIAFWRGAVPGVVDAETDWHRHQSVEGRWIISEANGAERTSFSWSATVGRESPELKKQKRTELALAFKF